MKLKEIASRINAHLKRIAVEHPARPWYYPQSWQSGRYCMVKYVSYQSSSSLTKDEALAYLAWLDSGGIGKHYGHTEKEVKCA